MAVNAPIYLSRCNVKKTKCTTPYNSIINLLQKAVIFNKIVIILLHVFISYKKQKDNEKKQWISICKFKLIYHLVSISTHLTLDKRAMSLHHLCNTNTDSQKLKKVMACSTYNACRYASFSIKICNIYSLYTMVFFITGIPSF